MSTTTTTPASETVGLLPGEFTLHVSHRADGWWVVTSSGYPGLYLAHRNLAMILEDVPLSLATLLRLNAEATS